MVLSGLCQDAYLIDLSCASTTGLYDITARQMGSGGVAACRHRRRAAGHGRAYHACGDWPARRGGRSNWAATRPSRGGRSLRRSAGQPGCGSVGEGVAAVSLGTSGAMRAVRRAPAVDEAARLFCYALTDDHWVLGGAINNAGSVVRWASAALGMVTPEVQGEERDEADGRLLQEADRCRSAAKGCSACRTCWASGPLVGAWAAGAWIGLRRHHRRGHLVRSAVEGVCMQLALVELAWTRPACGNGGARNRWCDGVAGMA